VGKGGFACAGAACDAEDVGCFHIITVVAFWF